MAPEEPERARRSPGASTSGWAGRPDHDLPGLPFLGTGAALTIPTAGTAAVGSVDEAHAGSAGGLSFMFHLVVGAIGVAIVTAVFSAQESGTSTGAEFVEGLHATYWLGTAVAAASILNARLIRISDARMASR